MALVSLGVGLACFEQQHGLTDPDLGVISVTVGPLPLPAGGLYVGDTVRLTATVLMSNNRPPHSVDWASAAPGVATVDAAGLVRGIVPGRAVIVASAANHKDSTTVTVVPQPVMAVLVTPPAASLAVGTNVQLTATPEDGQGNPLTGRPVTWASSNAAIAAVTATGLVTAMAPGSAAITASSEGRTGAASVTTTLASVAAVTITPSSPALRVGQTLQLAATTKDSAGNVLAGRAITWTSSNSAVATVSASGVITGVTAGTATITATSEGKTGTASITVALVPVASVTISPATASIYVGATKQLTATLKDSAGNTLTGRMVTWASSNATVATISTVGLVTGKLAGTATMTATSEGKSGTAGVSVALVPVATVTVSPATASVVAGATVQFTATTKDSAGNVLTGRSVTWTSSGPALATVGSTGLATGVAAGAVTITATSEGQAGAASLTVTSGSGTCTPTLGTFGVGIWPPACYHAYGSTAWINRLLPATPGIDPNSASLVAAFNAHGPPDDKCAGCTNDYDHPIYWAKVTDPVYTISGCGYSGALNGTQIHALKGMVPGGGTDGHVVVMDQATNMEWDFWQAVIDDNARTIGGHACGGLPIAGDGRVTQGDGANAAITGLYSGQIRAAELFAGVITHAVAIDASCTNGRYVYPAAGTALGGCANDPADGQFFQLTYSDAEIDALPVAAWQKVVLHAMHQYGFYIDDTGSGAHNFALHFESDKMYEAYGYEDPFVTYAKQHLGENISQSGGAYYYQIGRGVDWSRIQVIKPCTIQGTC